MQLSVVVPTLNGRERLSGCLDALATHAPAAEVVVVNGPSTDGTTGMVRDREDVDVLLELSERNLNVARNAGIAASTGDVVAFLSDALRPESGWAEAVGDAIADGAHVATGPVTRGGDEAAGTATSINGDNVAFDRETLVAIDGFDEYLGDGGIDDSARRLADCDYAVEWMPGMSVTSGVGTDGGSAVRPRTDVAGETAGWGLKYRSLGYRLAKNSGPVPTVAGRVLWEGVSDAVTGVRMVLDDDAKATDWLGTGREAGRNVLRGLVDGATARVWDGSGCRNPNGLSARSDRPVEEYDWRE